MPSFLVSLQEKEYRVEVKGSDRYVIDGKEHQITFTDLGKGRFSAILNAKPVVIIVPASVTTQTCMINGKVVKVSAESERARLIKTLQVSHENESGSLEVRAPMPAMVSSVAVRTGERVRAGQGLVILEAMKMENEIKATGDGVVGEILVTAGRSVEKGELLIVLTKHKEEKDLS